DLKYQVATLGLEQTGFLGLPRSRSFARRPVGFANSILPAKRRIRPSRPSLRTLRAFLQRIYVLFFISLASRRIEYIASTPNPDGRWVTQQARNLVMQLGNENPFR